MFGLIYKIKREWNQIRKYNDNGNYYFIKLFGLDGKQNHIVYNSFSFYLFHLYK